MRGVVVHAPKDLRIEELADVQPGPGEVRVRISAGGICGSDLHYFNHGGTDSIRLREPMILGHEIAGTVVERHYFGEITHLVVDVPGMEKPLSVTETNDFGADDLPLGARIRLGYDPDALVALAD